jgi:Methylamine utilisation protein MauE
MDVLTIAAKAMLAVLLLTAGGGKLADIVGFAATVRLFVPVRVPGSAIWACSLGIAVGEAVLGAVSLSWPSAAWPNLAVLALACGFLGVSAVGYTFYRGRSCSCFGALSRRRFDVVGIIRSAVVCAAAVIPISGIQSADLQAGDAARGLLAAGAVLLAYASFTAARALGATMRG